MKKLDIGSGNNRRDSDFITVDKYAEKADVKADMWDLPYKDGEIDLIWASHVLEHAPMAKVPVTLKEWHRVLRVGGKLIVQVPNFDHVAKYWLTGPDRIWAEQMVFGHQANEGEFHKSAFTPALLKGDLVAAGFTVRHIEFRWTHGQESIQAVCVKEEKPLAENVKPPAGS